MNMRIYKKRAKRAREILIAHYGFRPGNFGVVERGDEYGYELFGLRNSPDPLKGTPIIVERDYWTADCDIACVLSYLDECQHWDISDKQLTRRFRDIEEEGKKNGWN